MRRGGAALPQAQGHVRRRHCGRQGGLVMGRTSGRRAHDDAPAQRGLHGTTRTELARALTASVLLATGEMSVGTFGALVGDPLGRRSLRRGDRGSSTRHGRLGRRSIPLRPPGRRQRRAVRGRERRDGLMRSCSRSRALLNGTSVTLIPTRRPRGRGAVLGHVSRRRCPIRAIDRAGSRGVRSVDHAAPEQYALFSLEGARRVMTLRIDVGQAPIPKLVALEGMTS